MGTLDLDGIFEKAFDKLVDDQLSGAISDYNINKNRPSVTTLEFHPVPAKKAEEIRNVRTGLFGGGTKKQLAASIDEGKTTFAEVLVLAKEKRVVDRSDDHPELNTLRYFYKVADLNGDVIREDVSAIADDYVINFECNNGDSATDTGSPDKVNPEAYTHAYILHYYLKDEQFYVLLTKEQFEDMPLLVKYAGTRWHFVEDGVGYKW